MEKAEARARLHPEHRDLFLCHAWDDRDGAARQLYDELVACNATAWFSETEVSLGKPLLREIDRGLAMSRIGLVLVIPAMLPWGPSHPGGTSPGDLLRASPRSHLRPHEPVCDLVT